jgi:acetyl-CoA acetyltransferase
MWESRGKVAIAGVGYSELTRGVTGPLGLRAMEACRNAAADAGVALDQIDGIATYPEAPFRGAGHTDGIDVVTVDYILKHLDLAPEIRWYAQTEQGMVLSAVIEAVNAVAAGACNYALVWRALHRPQGTYGSIRSNTVTGPTEFLLPYGFGASFQLHALSYQRYMSRFGAKREHMATMVVNQRNNANKNERAFFHDRPMTRDDYMDARMIADPLCLFDCDVPVEGAVAVVITSAERARDLKNPPAYVAGYGQNTDRRPTLPVYTLVDYMKSGQSIMNQIWDRSGLGTRDVDVAELYDGFSPSTYYWLESAGFCGKGEAYQFVQDGRVEIGGELPVNTHGGALSEGRLHSMGHLGEAVFQITGRAGPRQVEDCNVALVTAGSPMLRGSGVLLTSQP